MDPISDYLTRLRNAIKANHRVVEVPASNLKKEITKIKFDENEKKQGTIKIALKYHPVTKIPAIRKIERISRPGLRNYAGVSDLPRVLNGLGIAILSTSHGVMTNKQAVKENVGGEVLCFVY
jgi:small subunit ribosomal protein S8